MIRSIISAGALSYAVFAAADVVHVEFDENLTNETTAVEARWTYPENFAYISEWHGYRLSAKDNLILSPVFPFAITNVNVLTLKTSSGRQLLITPANSGNDPSLIRDLTPIEDKTYETVSCQWSIDDDVRSFAISIVGTSGNVYLYSADISGAAVPYRLTNGTVYRNAFEACYQLPTNALPRQTLFSVEEFVERPASYSDCGTWSFENAVNDRGSSRKFLPGELEAMYPGISGENVQIAKETHGSVQIGSYSTNGNVTVAFVPPDARLLLLELSKPEDANYGTTLPIGLVTGNLTNVIADVTITPEFRTYVVPLPEITDDSSLVISSTTNHLNWKDKRTIVNVRSIALARDYRPPHVEIVPAAVHLLARPTATNATVVTDHPGRFVWRARCRDREAGYSPLSVPCEITLPADAPRLGNVYGTVLFVR